MLINSRFAIGFVLTAGLCCFATSAPTAASESAILHWVAGDSLPGQLIAADDSSITWKSPVFAAPLKIDPAVLSMIEFPVGASGSGVITDSLRVSMLNGDVLFGKLLSVQGDVFRLQCSRFGAIDLQRSQIRSLRSIESPGLVFLGPQGLAGWRHPLFPQWTEPPGWRESGDGRLTTEKSEAVMFRPTEFPPKCEIEVVLSSSRRPSFVMALGSNAESSLRLETWDNALVAMSQDDFVSVDTIMDSQQKIHLFLFVDFEARTMTIFSDAGKRLAEIKSAAADFGRSGVLLRNGEHDLTLEYLSIANWDGSPFQGVQSDRSRVHTSDGRVLYGKVVGVGNDQQSIRVSDGDREAEIPLTDIRGLIVNEGEAEATAQEDGASRIMFYNGELISGQIQSVSQGRIAVRTGYSVAPLNGLLDGAQRIQLSGTVTPPDEPDRMYFPEGSLRGTLMVDDHPQAPIRWKPLGGLNASTLQAGGTARFVRGAKAARISIDAAAFPDVVYLTNNDVIPCRLISTGKDSIQIKSPFCDVHEIAADQIRAVELQQPFRGGRQGFGDSGWRRIVGTPQIEPDRLKFRASEAVGHTSVMKGDVMKFTLNWEENVAATLTFHLYTQLPSNLPTGTMISFICRGDRVAVQGGSMAEAALIARGVPAASPGAEVAVSHRTANVTIFRQGDKIRVSVDGQLANTFSVVRSSREAQGLLIRANIINTPREAAPNNRRAGAPKAGAQPADARRRVDARRQVDSDWTMQVSDFEVRDIVGDSIRQFVDDETREAVLTIPRFRRDNPPSHVLLAPNGDLLRGRLIDASDQGVVFESRLEKIRLERERVAAIIWLKPEPATDNKPTDIAAAASPENTVQPGRTVQPGDVAPPQNSGPPEVAEQVSNSVQVVMERGIFLTMSPTEIKDGRLIGTSERLGKCSVPADGIRELSIGHWDNGSQSASYTLWVPRLSADPNWDIPEDSGTSPASQMVGETAPGIQLPMLDGGLFRLPDHKDKIVVLDFWATWCGPCVQALPACMSVTSQFDSSRVMFIAVNLEETPQAVKAFLDRHQLAPLVALDRTGITGAEFNVSGIPHSVVIGPDNVIEHVRIGYRPGAEEELREVIQQLLDGTWKRPEKDGPTPDK